MNIGSIAMNFQRNAQTFGIQNALHDIALRGLNRSLFFHCLRCLVIDKVDPALLVLNPKYRGAFLDRAALQTFAKDSSNEMDLNFIAAALAKGDECYGIVDGDTLASYGWYSTKLTAFNEDLQVQFSSDRVYMYKGFTHPRYRGQRLHAIGHSLAHQSYLERGFEGIVTYVESNNFASIKSARRMGYRDLGWVIAARILGQYRLWTSPGCRQNHFQLVKARVP